MMTLADYLAHFLVVQGIDRVFGLPGGENVTVVDSLRKAGIDLVLMHHETQAGFAADVSGQLTGKPGVCLSTVGPGAVNLAAAAAAATLERSPMLAITAEIDSRRKPHVTHMKVDLQALFGSVTKGSFPLMPESAGATLSAAWQLALAPPRGTVHLSVAPDLAKAEVDLSPGSISIPKPDRVNEETLSLLESLLRQALNLFILAGLGVEAAGVQAELLALAEAWQVPVAVTPKAKGHFPESHALFAGCYSAYGDGPLRQALDDASIILGVGLDSVDFVSSNWTIQTPVVNLNLAGADDPALKPILAVNGDLQEILHRLALDRFDRSEPQEPGQTRAASLRQAIARQLLDPPIPAAPGTITLHDLITTIRHALPEDGAVTVDVGAFKLVFLQQWRTDKPRSLFVANGLSAMGYALPAALAIRLAQPERPVVAIAGDGALLMYAGELATAARLAQPLVILVVVDQAYSLIRLKQLRQDVPVYGTEFGRTDFAALAGAFGIKHMLLDGQVDPQAVMQKALLYPGPVLVEAQVNGAEYERYR